MEKVKLRIAELRHRNNITQQQLAEIVGVSFQTVSKWENGSNMPDITYLPVLAQYFKVSIDQLMGIVPLNGEEYIAEKTGTGQFWENKMEYLLRTRKTSWNHDYVRFMIEQVWKINKPVKMLDCGCGFGFLGMLMMPFLPEGSTYTGIDLAEKLLEKGKTLFAETDYNAQFIHKDVAVRMNDRVNFVTPQMENYEHVKKDFIEYNDWNARLSPEDREKTIQFFMTHGMSRKEAAEYCDQNNAIEDFFQTHPDAGYTFARGTMISYGKK